MLVDLDAKRIFKRHVNIKYYCFMFVKTLGQAVLMLTVAQLSGPSEKR